MTIDLVLRESKGSSITWEECDQNFRNLLDALTTVCPPVIPVGTTKALVYGGSLVNNIATLLSNTANLIQPENNIGTARYGLAGANVGVNALFYGGSTIDGNFTSNTVTILSSTATLVQPESNIGESLNYVAGASINSKALFYSGWKTFYTPVNTVMILNEVGNIIQPNVNIGTPRYGIAGTSLNNVCLFINGHNDSNEVKVITLISEHGILLNEIGFVSTNSRLSSLASTSSNIIKYGGYPIINSIELLDNNGILLQPESYLGTARYGSAGANVGVNALFYGGDNNNRSNIATILTSSAILVQLETSIGTARSYPAGAAI